MIQPTQEYKDEESPCTKNGFQTHFSIVLLLMMVNISMEGLILLAL